MTTLRGLIFWIFFLIEGTFEYIFILIKDGVSSLRRKK